MKLPRSVFEAIGYSYYTYFDEKSPAFVNKYSVVQEADEILNAFNIKKQRNLLKYLDFIYINPFISKKKKIHIKNAPYSKLSKIIINDIEQILNNPDYELQNMYMGPLLDCIGWIITNNTGKVKINFIGSYTYDIWKELYDLDPIVWYDDISKKDLEWWAGDDWQDGWNIQKMKLPLWKNVEEKEYIEKNENWDEIADW